MKSTSEERMVYKVNYQQQLPLRTFQKLLLLQWWCPEKPTIPPLSITSLIPHSRYDAWQYSWNWSNFIELYLISLTCFIPITTQVRSTSECTLVTHWATGYIWCPGQLKSIKGNPSRNNEIQKIKLNPRRHQPLLWRQSRIEYIGQRIGWCEYWVIIVWRSMENIIRKGHSENYCKLCDVTFRRFFFIFILYYQAVQAMLNW